MDGREQQDRYPNFSLLWPPASYQGMEQGREGPPITSRVCEQCSVGPEQNTVSLSHTATLPKDTQTQLLCFVLFSLVTSYSSRYKEFPLHPSSSWFDPTSLPLD